MDQPQPQPPLTPEQQKKVKKAKAILWIGIIGIIVIGSLVGVYFMFLKTSDPCNWRPDNSEVWMCKNYLGEYYNGEKCVAIGRCDGDQSEIPFNTQKECEAACLK